MMLQTTTDDGRNTVIIMTNRKSHMRFRLTLTPRSMTIWMTST